MEEKNFSTMTLGDVIRDDPEFVEERIRFLLDERKILHNLLQDARVSFLYIATTYAQNPVLAGYAKRAARKLSTVKETLKKDF